MKQKIIDYAHGLGIDAIGFTTPEIPAEDVAEYLEFIESKNYGDMTWMESRAELRLNPLKLHPPTKTIIMIGVNYFDSQKPKYDYEISIYANQQLDYHTWVWEKARDLAKFLDGLGGESRYFVDSAPILERVFAKKTMIGWAGKHTCVVSRKYGSWLFLGSILTSIELEPDIPHKDMCGSCTKCIDACPTKALTPYHLDVSKCLAYYTVEHKGEIPADIAAAMETKIFGCDDCLAACHFNKFATQSQHREVAFNERFPKSLEEISSLNEESFGEIFKKTPLKRLGLKNLLRNVDIAIKNRT
ncbi:MAG: tRNA epoxyqueuosine(34) reductase QueG [Alphaproteobacteria bacterium]|jgi:epoxyqueuosine reductase|nr:tRNA epoxyqueuosine(34) reductase QueG [Alphaproteobacteria bacterium]